MKKLLILIYLSAQSFFNPLGILSPTVSKFCFYGLSLIALYFSYKKKADFSDFPIKLYKYVLLGICLSVLSAGIFQDQSLLTTFITTIPYLLGYSFLYILLKQQPKFEVEGVLNGLVLISFVIYITNIITFPNMIFTAKSTEEIDTSRGLARIGVPMIEIVVMSFFYTINQWIINKRKSSFIWLAITSFLIVVSLTRQVILVSFLLGLLFVMHKASKVKKVTTVVVALVLAFYIVPKTSIYQSLMEVSTNQYEKNAYQKEDIRITAWKYYTVENQTNAITPIIGNGVPAYGKSRWGTRFMKEVEYEYGGNGCFTADVGWAGYFWYFGAISTVSLLLLIIKGILRTKKETEMYLTYSLLFVLLTAIASAPILHHNQILGLCLILFLTYKKNDYDRNRNLKL